MPRTLNGRAVNDFLMGSHTPACAMYQYPGHPEVPHMVWHRYSDGKLIHLEPMTNAEWHNDDKYNACLKRAREKSWKMKPAVQEHYS